MLMSGSLAGCAEDAAAPVDEAPVRGERDVSDPWAGGDRLVVAERTSGDMAMEFDVVCVFGGGVELSRSGDRIAAGTSHLEVTLTVPAVYTGYQVGYSIESGETVWLDTVAAGEEAVQAIEVAPDQIEEDGRKWTFHMRANVSSAEQDCYTGGGHGDLRITIEAVRGAA